jgi:hypothetical protein
MSDKDKAKHEFNITVNARAKTVASKELSFDELLALGLDTVPSGPQFEFMIAYRRGEGNKPEGTLSQGETLKVKDGMIIDVTVTDTKQLQDEGFDVAIQDGNLVIRQVPHVDADREIKRGIRSHPSRWPATSRRLHLIM